MSNESSRADKLEPQKNLALFLVGNDGNLTDSVEGSLCSDILLPLFESERRRAQEVFDLVISNSTLGSDASADEISGMSVSTAGDLIPTRDTIIRPLNDAEIGKLRSHSVSLFGRNPPDSFFDFSSWSWVPPDPLEIRRELCEATNGEQKRDHVSYLYQVLPILDGFCDISERLETAYVMTFALSNRGLDVGEDIRILISFPETVRVLGPGALLPPPARESIPYLLRRNGLLRDLLFPRRRDRVQVVFPSNAKNSWFLSPSDQLYNIDPVFDSYESHVRNALNYCTLDVGNGTTVIEIRQPYHLKHGEAIEFAPRLLVEANRSFDVTYEISSKQYPQSNTGVLRYGV